MKINYVAIDTAIKSLFETYPNLVFDGKDDLTPADFITTGAVLTGLNASDTTNLLRKSFEVLGGDLFNPDLLVSAVKTRLQTVKRAVR